MLAILLAISVISFIIFIFKLMKNSSLRYIIAPLAGLTFGYLIYFFGGALYIYFLLPILVLPIIAMIFALRRK